MRNRFGCFLRVLSRWKTAVFCLILCTVLVFGMFPCAPFSAEELFYDISDLSVYPVSGGSLYFYPAEGTVVGCDPSVTFAEIPSAIDGVAVKKVGEYSFAGLPELTGVALPDTVTEIGDFAFSECVSLTDITLPESVKIIGVGAFLSCLSLPRIEIPSGAFLRDSLGSETIPEPLSFADFLFYGCFSLSEIEVRSGNLLYSSINGVLMNREQTKILKYPGGKTGSSYQIPDCVTDISVLAFSDSTALTALVVGDGNPVYASENGFLLSKDKKILFRSVLGGYSSALPEGITEIGDFAFFGGFCPASVVIPDTVTKIGAYAFAAGLYPAFTLPSGLCEIGDCAFQGLVPAEILFQGEKAGWEQIRFGESVFAFGTKVIGASGETVYVLNFLGDVNGDGGVDVRDSVLVARYLAKWEIVIDLQAADIDHSGDVNSRDRILLVRHLASWDIPYFHPFFS